MSLARLFVLFFIMLVSPGTDLSAQADSIPLHGILVDAGGHKLHLDIRGHGGPVVVLENGSADFSFVWSLVQPSVAQFTTVVSYDRAGYAWSEPGPSPRTARQIVYELHKALTGAGLKSPYILVGQSYGGFLVRAFARHYPKEVAGMVLVEALNEDAKINIGKGYVRIREMATGRKEPPVNAFFTPGAGTRPPVSLIDTSIEFPLTKLADSILRLQVWAQSQPSFIAATDSEMTWSPEDVAELYRHRGEKKYLLGNIPLIVLTRGLGGYEGIDSAALENERLSQQEALSRLSTNSKHLIDKNSGHNIHLEDPDLVVAAIREVFEAVRNHRRL
ncbi:MAG TPA: alpha/beta hydrolase [Puia sp.]|nr:alpha/beta hydrolase [Puia sp.]